MREIPMITRQDGRNFITGIGQVLFFCFLIAYAIQFGLNYFNFGVDSSDLNGFNRSGLHIYTDRATGIQYLGDGKGGLTPRLDQYGWIVGAKTFDEPCEEEKK